jgi:hydrogenase nickel incorporation protein HypB
MCGTCGCGDDEHITYRNPDNPDSHLHEHSHFHEDKEHSHSHHHEHDHIMIIHMTIHMISS